MTSYELRTHLSSFISPCQDRIISDEYIRDTTNTDYNTFYINYLLTKKTDEISDIKIPDEYYELNVNAMIDKFRKKGLYKR